MKQKWLKLAGEMLRDHAENLGNRGCNDWNWPADWTPEERLEFARMMVRDNISFIGDTLPAEAEKEATDMVKHGSSDFWVASVLSRLLRGEART